MISNTAILDLESQDSPRDGYVSSGPGAFFGNAIPIVSNDRARATEQRLATLKLVLTQARQSVSSDPMGARHFVDRALELLSSMAGRTAADDSAYDSGGLASWQARRAKSMIEARLSGRLLVSDLASAVRLSPSHFARAFKRSVGVAPHHWMVLRRCDLAKHLLQTTILPLTEVALACGFADQSHFTRVFSRVVGIPPGSWRKML